MTGHPDSWLRHELRRKLTELAELRLRLATTERHNADLQRENAALRAQLAEPDEVRALLTPVQPFGPPPAPTTSQAVTVKPHRRRP